MDLSSVNALVGSLILTNLGLIGSVIWVGFKLVWFAAELSHKVKENEKDITNAWKEIKFLREKL